MNFNEIILRTNKYENFISKLKNKDSRAGLILLITSQWKIYMKKYILYNHETAYIYIWLNILYLSNLDQISFILKHIENDRLVLFSLSEFFFTNDVVISVGNSIKNKKHKKYFCDLVNRHTNLKNLIIKKMNVIGRAYKTYKFKQRLLSYLFTNLFLKKYLYLFNQ